MPSVALLPDVDDCGRDDNHRKLASHHTAWACHGFLQIPLSQRGEQVYRPRKSAVRHSNPKGAKSAETIDDDGDGREEPTTKRAHNDSEDKGEQEPASATKRPRVDDDEEDSNNDKDEADNNHDTTADNTADGNAVDEQYNADNTGMTIGNVAI